MLVLGPNPGLDCGPVGGRLVSLAAPAGRQDQDSECLFRVVGCRLGASGERQQCEGQPTPDPQSPLWVPSPPLAMFGRTFADGHQESLATGRNLVDWSSSADCRREC